MKLNPADGAENKKPLEFFSLTDEEAPASGLAAPPNTKLEDVLWAGAWTFNAA